ncbi:MAG: hypothetical protein AABX03_00430, partial [Nanoarchaeota archaeon]
MVKKGDISISVIIGLVIAIIGFTILLLVYSQLNWSGSIDSETCHQSAIYRGTLPSLAKNYVPLKCQTKKICITTKIFGRGNCEEFKNDQGIEFVRVGDGEKGLRQIEKTYSDEILDCWSMMGEGKINLFSNVLAQRYGATVVYPSCVVCSRIAIDKSSFENTDFKGLNVLRYMEANYVPGKQETYAQYLSGGLYNSAISLKTSQVGIPKIEEYDENGVGLGNKDIFDLEDLPVDPEGTNNLKESAIVFMQVIGPPDQLQGATNVLNDAGISLGTSVVLSPVTTAKAIKGVAKGGWFTLATLAIVGAYQQGSIFYNKAVTAGYCGDVAIGDKSERSCSVVRTVNYDVSDIVRYCPNV